MACLSVQEGGDAATRFARINGVTMSSRTARLRRGTGDRNSKRVSALRVRPTYLKSSHRSTILGMEFIAQAAWVYGTRRFLSINPLLSSKIPQADELDLPPHLRLNRLARESYFP